MIEKLQWHDAEKEKPMVGMTVMIMVDIGCMFRRSVQVIWQDGDQVECETGYRFEDDCVEFSEEKNDYTVKKGWYEIVCSTEKAYEFTESDKITAWAYMPVELKKEFKK